MKLLKELKIDTSFEDIDQEGLGDYLDLWDLDVNGLVDLLGDGYTYNMDDNLVKLDHSSMVARMYETE